MKTRLSGLPPASLVLLLLALGLRAWGLGAGSVTHDEAYGLWVASRPLADVLPATARDVHPPLYYLLLHAWLTFGSQSDVWTRLPSALVGAALTPAVYALGRRLWNAQTGRVAALLAALSPLAVAQAREARMYPLAALLLTLAACALLRATAGHRRRWWIAYVFLSALALYTHYYAGFVLVAFTCYVVRIAYCVKRTTDRRPQTTDRVLLSLLSISISLLYLPWLPALLDQLRRVRAGFWIPPPSPESLGQIAQTLAFYAVTPRPAPATPEDFAVKAVGACCVAAALLMPVLIWLWPHADRRPPTADRGLATGDCRLVTVILPVLWLIIPIALAYAVSLPGPSILEPRYFAVCLPAFWLLVAQGITALPGRALKAMLLAGLVVASLASLHTFATFPAYRPPDARAAAAWLRAHVPPGDLIVHTSQFSLRPIVWYNGDDAAGVLADDPTLPARLASAAHVFLVAPYDVRRADGPRQADTAAADWAKAHHLWDLQTVARFWGLHIYEWSHARMDE